MKQTLSKLLEGAYFVTVFLILAIIVSLPFRRPASDLEHGPLIQNTTTNAFSVVWRQEGNEAGVLSLRGNGINGSRFAATQDGARYEARAEGLTSGTAYRYEILHTTSDGTEYRLFDGQAATVKPAGAPFTFTVFADSGTGQRHQFRLAQVMNRYPTDFILHAGDLVYKKGKARDYRRKFFSPYRELISHIPFYPVLGNHDVATDNGQPFLDIFSPPKNGPPSIQPGRCYTFDYGDARFVGIDSTLDSETLATAVAPWLQETLADSSITWRFVYFHHPPWAGGKRPGNAKIRDTLVPAIEAAGVDIVFCGHNHLYERTHPITGGEIAPSNGVIYIISGAGGKTLHDERTSDAPYLNVSNDAEYSFTWVTINGPRLELMQISEDDAVLDTFILVKDAETKP